MNKKFVLGELERQKEKTDGMERIQITSKKEKEMYCKERYEPNFYSRVNKLKLMKQLKRISTLRIQRNTRKEGKTLMKWLNRVSKTKIQSNTRKEGNYDQEILNRCYKKPWVYKEKSDVRSREISEMLQWKNRMSMQNLWQIFKKDMVSPRLSDHKPTI